MFRTCFCCCSVALRALHSFPTRRSSDLLRKVVSLVITQQIIDTDSQTITSERVTTYNVDLSSKTTLAQADVVDRKSTRLNSSHVAISYAVFCLKKKNSNMTH